VTGIAVARHASAEGREALVIEDAPGGDAFAGRRAEVERLGGRVVVSPPAEEVSRLVAGAHLVVPSPGIPVTHPVYAAAAQGDVPLVSEIELAASVARVPIVAVTGTNGKTTVATLVTRMLVASGVRAAAAGNIGRPLIEAVYDDDVDVIVAEVSSFQLEYTERFRPRVAVLLNVDIDHLDWHPDAAHYRDAKAKVFARQSGDDALVAVVDDPVVAALAETAPARVVRCRVARPESGSWCVTDGVLTSAEGEPVVAVGDLPRARPPDLANALAAAAASVEAGGRIGQAARVLTAFRGLPHRLELVGDAGGVRYYDDSKATNPHATVHAVEGFKSVVLLAGGRDKGLPLDALLAAEGSIREVVAFGEAGPVVAQVFQGRRPVTVVSTVADAVAVANNVAQPGDAVILSPACASFDAYPDYAARGDDFRREVTRLPGVASA
jgi:UDP-N-acetylmuramoylalanine--D-glutamate ligase